MPKQNKILTKIKWGVMTLLSLGVAIFLLVSYMTLKDGRPTIQLDDSFGAHMIWLYVHVFCSSLALLIGPFQFLPSLRKKYLSLHRWFGRIYLGVGVFAGGVSGLILAIHSRAGLTAQVGFSFLAVLWLITGWKAYSTIRKGQVQQHKEWMIRNYALSFAAVTLRIWLGIGIPFLLPQLDTTYGGDFDLLFREVYLVVPWLCWVPNLIVAEIMVRKMN